MTPFKQLKSKPTDSGSPKMEFLRVNHTKGSVKAQLRYFTFKDKDTKQIVCYMPSLEISGYGATDIKAREMLKFSLDEFLKFLTKLSLDEIEKELNELGWKHDNLKRKEYSKAFIDKNGNLKEFNAVENKIEEKILTI